MLPSARRAELTRQYFDNSYLSRKAFEVDAAGDTVGLGAVGVGEAPYHHYPHRVGKSHASRDGSFLSRTTAGLSTCDEVPDTGLDFRGGQPRNSGRLKDYARKHGQHAPYRDRTPSHDSTDEAEVSDSHYSDQESSSSFRSEDSFPSTAKSYETGIRYSSSSPAAEIWQILHRMDDMVLEVKANVLQCQRLGARLAALKKPMVAVHKGRQTADHTVLATTKALVTESQHFMERFLDPEWWRKGAGRKEDSETFRELTFRLGKLMQAPPGFQQQSEEEDHVDRLTDYADLQSTLENKLRTAKDARTSQDAVEALRRVRAMVESEGAGPPEIDMRMVHYDKQQASLGNGGFGTVFVATLKGMQVAVKKLNNQNVRPHLLEDMRDELLKYQQLQYDFVVKTIGGCTSRPNVCVIVERAPHSLFHLLHNQAEFSPPALSTGEGLGSGEKAAMLWDVARGLQFLHIKGIVHGNLKSTNVLVFENNHLKVSDFGLIAVRESQSVMGGGDTVHSAAWTAPEVLDDKDASILSDVYSFGVLIHEVLTQRIPFAGKSVAKVITAVVAKCHRPGYLENEEETMPKGLVKLADVCWTQEPSARPTSLNTIVTELGHIVNAMGGDPRSPPNYQTTDEKASTRPLGNGTPSSKEGMSSDERRIRELEEELRKLKMKQQGDSGSSSGKKALFAPEDGGPVVGIPEERAALRVLYTATQGPAWRKRQGWETNEPDLSKWDGVVCGNGGHVTALRMPSNNLHGQLPRELDCLSRLEALDLSDNLLEGSIPLMFGKLERLVELNLSMNDLTASIPSDLGNCVSLEKLILQCNGFDGNVPRSLLKLNNLKIFNADWRSLYDTHPFRHFRKASPPMTEAEFDRAKSGSRRAAVDRAASVAGPVTQTPSSQQQQHMQHAGNGVGAAGMTRLQLQQQEFSPSSSICRDSGGSVLGYGGPRAASVGKYLTPRSSTSGSGSPGVVTPFRSRLLNRKRFGGAAGEGMRSPSSSGHSPAGSAATSRSGFAVRRSGSGQFSDFSYTAPTAPYQGDDGLVGKAKAAARAAAKAKIAPKSSGVKSAWKFFKDVVAIEMHPGYSEEVVTKAKTNERAT